MLKYHVRFTGPGKQEYFEYMTCVPRLNETVTTPDGTFVVVGVNWLLFQLAVNVALRN